MTDKTEAMDLLIAQDADLIDGVMAYLNEPYEPVQVIKDLLEHGVFAGARSGECNDAVENARGYLEQEASQPTQSDALREQIGLLYQTLTYVSEASVCELSRNAAKETIAKVDALQEQSR